MAYDTIKYDVYQFTRQLDQLGNLFYIERLILDIDTNNEELTASFEFEAETFTSAAVSNSARGMINIDVNRLGPLQSVSLTPIDSISWYAVELFVRPVVLGLNIIESGSRVLMPGRTVNAATSLIFDINPFAFPEDARHINPVIRRMWIDAEAGDNTITPVLTFDDGTTTSLTAISSDTRIITEYSILTAKRVKNVTLQGDFSDGEVVLYSLEVDVYIPSARRMAIG